MATRKTVQAEDDTTVTMRGTWPYAEEFTGVEHFYEGSLPVEHGLIKVPRERVVWIARLKTTGWDFVNDEDREKFENIVL